MQLRSAYRGCRRLQVLTDILKCCAGTCTSPNVCSVGIDRAASSSQGAGDALLCRPEVPRKVRQGGAGSPTLGATVLQNGGKSRVSWAA